MLRVGRVLVRDAASKALLLVMDVSHTKVRVEGTATSLVVEDLTTGKTVVEAVAAHLVLLDGEAVHYEGATRLRDQRELRHVRVTLELR